MKSISIEQLEYELQCQEALLVLMQKLRNNQKLISSSVADSNKQRSTVTSNSNATATVKSTPTLVNRTKFSQSNQNSTLHRNSQSSPSLTSKTNPSSVLPSTRTSTTPVVTKTSVQKSATNLPTKPPSINAEQQLLNAKLALRKQLEQTLLKIPTPKPTNCDLNYIPSMNGWSEFLSQLGLEQAFHICNDGINRRPLAELHFQPPNLCIQCGIDWSVIWHKVDEKIFCDRCRRSSQKKSLKQDHSNRLRQAFIQALQQEKELDAKFQQPATTTKSKPTTTAKKSHSQHHHRVKHQPISQPPPLDPFAMFSNNEQLEYLQKHFLPNMIPFAMANQLAAALATKSSSQQQLLAASLPAMAVSLLQQQNPAQYLLDMIPQAAKHHHHQQHRSK